MDQRKLIKLGNSSFAIALPKQWVDKSGLKKGDDVFLEENSNGEIMLWSKLKKISDEKLKEIDTEEDSSKIRKGIIAAYINGFTKIKLKTIKDKKKKKELKEFLNELLGFEIIEENEQGIVSKDFFDISEAKINNFIKRMDNNLRESFETFLAAMKAGQLRKSALLEISKADVDTTRFHMLISRLFFRGINNPSVLNALKKDSFEFLNDWLISQNLEHIGDILKESASLFFKLKINKEKMKDLSNTFSEIFKCYEISVETVTDRNRERAILCAVKGKEIIKTCDVLAQDKNSSVAKLAIKFKELETSIYQNLKIIIYIREND